MVCVGRPVTAVVRDCNSSIPLQTARQVTITDRCLHDTFNYLYQRIYTIQVEATVCPCFASLCNAGNITLGQTVGTRSPPATTRTWIQSSSTRVARTQTVRTSPAVTGRDVTSSSRGGSADDKLSSSTPTSTHVTSTVSSSRNATTIFQSTSTSIRPNTTEKPTNEEAGETSYGRLPINIVAVILAAIVVFILVVIAFIVCANSSRCRRAVKV